MKITVLTSKYADEFQLSVINGLVKSKHKITGWVVDERDPKPLMKKFKSNLSKGRGGYVLVMALKYLFKKNKYSADIFGIMENTGQPVYFTKNINSSECTDKIKTFNADVLVLIGGFGLLKNQVLNICRYGVLSYHHGNMRKYRGQPPGFWELYNNEKEIGVTIQKLSEGLDCGELAMEMTIPVKYKDTLTSLQKRIYQNSTDLMVKALDFLDTDPVLKKLDEYGKVYTLPNLSQWLLFNFRIIARKIRLKPKW